jgi:alkylhydroperoxidase/carboxymuconolactone decarboxylase family protein
LIERFRLSRGAEYVFIIRNPHSEIRSREYYTVAYYEEDDLARFGEVGKHRPDLFEKFMAWYQACQEDGALSRREKALIGLAVAHALQCPYCIDAFSQSCLEAGSNMEQMTEAIHMASALRGGASLVHGVQAHNSVNKVSM